MSRGRLVIGDTQPWVRDRLFDDLIALQQQAVAQPMLLSRTIYVVTASDWQRRQLLSQFTCMTHAHAGIAFVTLAGLAKMIVQRQYGGTQLRSIYLSVLSARYAAQHRGLNALLGGQQRAFEGVAATVSDFFSAGYTVELAEVLRDVLRSIPANRSVSRAAAVLDVVDAVAVGMHHHGILRMPELLLRATASLRDEDLVGLGARAVMLYGIADATGVVTEFIRALMTCGATLYLARGSAQISTANGRRFSQRLVDDLIAYGAEDASEHPRDGKNGDGKNRVVIVAEAQDTSAEIRWVAAQIRRLIDENVAPERIGVIAKMLSPCETEIRRCFDAAGIPYCGSEVSPNLSQQHHQMSAAVMLLQRKDQTTIVQFLNALRPRDGRPVGSPSLGAITVSRIGQLLAVPSLAVCPQLKAVAASVLLRLSQWPWEATLAHHVDLFASLLRCDLQWSDEPWIEWLNSVSEQSVETIQITYAEFVAVLQRELRAFGAAPIGGASIGSQGSGVWVLNGTDARALTFEHLFVVGVNQGLFPLMVPEDPLLPDPIRTQLSAILEHLPIKMRAQDEEVYLFDALLHSAANVYVSRAKSDLRGGVCHPSAFLDFIDPQVPRQAIADSDCCPLMPLEVVESTALEGNRTAFMQVLSLGFEDVGCVAQVAEQLTHARLEVLNEYEPDLSLESGRKQFATYSPYWGEWVSSPDIADPVVYATTLENFVRCPWRSHLANQLRLRIVDPPPQVTSEVTAADIGTLVHDVLNRIATRDAMMPSVVDVSHAVVLEHCLKVGLYWPGLVKVVTRQVSDLAQVALRIAHAEAGEKQLVGVEQSVSYNGLKAQLGVVIGARADRIDRHNDRLVCTDYKTGKPISDAKRAETRAKHFSDAISRGAALQAAIYALATNGIGRYLYLDPGLADDARVFEVDAAVDGFFPHINTLLNFFTAMWRDGARFPRLEDDQQKEPSLCSYCDYSMACVRGDSAMRRRLRLYFEHRFEDNFEDIGDSRLADLWKLS